MSGFATSGRGLVGWLIEWDWIVGGWVDVERWGKGRGGKGREGKGVG